MPYKRKYRKGSQIASITELAAIIEAREYVFFYGRLMHWAWIRSMQFSYLLNCIRRGNILYRAERISQS